MRLRSCRVAAAGTRQREPSYTCSSHLLARRPAGSSQNAVIARTFLHSKQHEEKNMLHYAVVFLVIALIAAVFGFGGIAASAVGIAKILFVIFIVLAVASFLMGLLKK